MKRFLMWMAFPIIFAISVAALSQSVRWQPFTKPGDEAVFKHIKQVQVARDKQSRGEVADFLYPRAECEVTEFDFGLMSPKTNGKHAFQIKNTGTAPLELVATSTSCICTLGKVKDSSIAPGETGEVILEWTTSWSREFFRQEARVRTNDPSKPEIVLGVRGKVRMLVTATQYDFLEHGLPPDSRREVSSIVYSQFWDKFEVTLTESTSDRIRVLGIEDPDPSEVSSIASTYAKKVRMAIDTSGGKGKINGKIRLKIKPLVDAEKASILAELTQGEAEENPLLSMGEDGTLDIELSVVAEITNRICFYGPSINPAGVVEIAGVRQGTAKSRRLVVRVRGDKLPEDLVVSQVQPAFLRAEISESRVNSETGRRDYRLEITIPEDAPICTHSDGNPGEIIIEAVGFSGADQFYRIPVTFDVLD